MADLIDDLETYLKTQSTVTDVVGAGDNARIFQDRLREGATLPALVIVEGGGGESQQDLGGIVGFAESVMHVYAYARSRTAAHSLAEVVRVAGPLQGYRGTMGTTSVAAVVARSHRDSGFDPPADKHDNPKYWCRRIYSIHHVEPTS